MAFKTNKKGLVSDGIRRRATGISKAMKAAFREEGNNILYEANKLVPFDTFKLMKSGKVDVIQTKGAYEVVVFYDTEYAAAVHEINKNYNHGRQWLYLRVPMMVARAGFMARIRKRAKKHGA